MLKSPRSVKAPPTFKDLNERVKEYLLCPEKLPIHEWGRTMNSWPREVKIESLLDADEDEREPDSTLRVVRDLLTGEIVGLEEIELDNDEYKDSLSMSRPPLPPNYATLGTATQIPFLPAGFEGEFDQFLQATTYKTNFNLDSDHDEVGKFFGENILTAPPGIKDGVIFAEDGCSVLNKENEVPGHNQKTNMNINLESKFEWKKALSETTQFIDIWKDEDNVPKIKSKDIPKLPKIKMQSEFQLDDDLFENNINYQPVVIPKISEESEMPMLNISSSNNRTNVTSMRWAEIIDISQPVPDFNEKVKIPAMRWPFELDTFQKQAILKLEEKHHLFVAAHTSAGKTIVAEYAIAMSRRNFTRTIYTSPTKALSNQKYKDFSETFEEVGLLTGDFQINANASCLVMTTEILRSMLYRGSDVTRDLEFVIFDEVHYINHPERGHVWEEVLILLPAHVTIVMLSATAPNTLEFADWVGRTKKKKVYVVSTQKRPVPLCHYLYTARTRSRARNYGGRRERGHHTEGLCFGSESVRLDPDHSRIDQRVRNLSPRKPHAPCLGEHVKLPVADVVLNSFQSAPGWRGSSTLKAHLSEMSIVGDCLNSGGGGAKNLFLVVDRNGDFQLKGYNCAVANTKTNEPVKHKNFGLEEQAMWISFVHHLKENDKLPVVAFTLSRNRVEINALQGYVVANSCEMNSYNKLDTPKRCDQNAANLLSLNLTTAVEKCFIRNFLQKCLQKLKESDRSLPQVKILFATETFAMGVNMPARTIVFEHIDKYDGLQRRLLTPAEYIQMAGRAGRRGIDETGTVIILCKDGVPDLGDLREVMIGVPQTLTSQFRLTYAMILSLLRTTPVSVECMVQRSFREISHIEKYERQLRLAEKEYSEKCGTPLPLHLSSMVRFYNIGTAYIDAINKIMPIALGQPAVAKEILPGRIVVVTVGPNINQLAIVLSKTASRRTPYKILLLNTPKLDENSEKYDFEMDDHWYRLLSLYAYMGTEDPTLDHIILCVEVKNIVAITKITLLIDVNAIIQDWEKRQMSRFKNAPMSPSCLAAVRELSQLSCSVRAGATRLDCLNLSLALAGYKGEIRTDCEKIDKLTKQLASIEKNVNTANFKSDLAVVYRRILVEKKRDKYKRLLSSEDLNLYADYQNRLTVLRELNYVDKNGDISLKGRVACTMGSRNELILTEILFRNVFADKTPAEIAALLSCFVFQAKTRVPHVLTEKLMEGVQTIERIDAELLTIGNKYKVREFEFVSGRLNFGLVRVVYEWALEKSFAEIMDHTDVQEGIIVRCMQQLHEVYASAKLLISLIIGTTKSCWNRLNLENIILQHTKLYRFELPANDMMRRCNTPRSFLLLPRRLPILRHCDAFGTNFTAAEFRALYSTSEGLTIKLDTILEFTWSRMLRCGEKYEIWAADVQ
ncbi:Helicase SKI2W [Eumeta japonica]|uniref:Helicase SKI2W n=1 Tax=Eumeta variegata TaxID=151549 RepID=A0A4C1WTZ6_EUMVA|nr:Helicase SKI2W [Eumeta japonica]